METLRMHIANRNKMEVEKIGLELQNSIKVTHFNHGDLEEDELARDLVPQDHMMSGKHPWRAIKTTGDGNCLYNAVSIALTGSEKLARHLRMAVAAELFVNAHRYTHHPNIEIIDQSKVGAYSPETFFCTTLTEDGQSTYNTSTRLSTILAEAEGTSTDGKWSSLIHLFALANVLGRNINSIYPSHNAALRPLFNSIIRPHSTPSASLPPINILWSRTSLDERRGAVFEPNHFVPIIVSDYECQHNEPTFDDDGINYAEIDINNSKDPVIASVAGAYAVLNEDYTTDDDRPLSHFVQLKPSKKTAQTTARERTQISQKTTRIAVQDITQNDCIDHELEMYDTFNTSEVAYDVDNSDIEIGDIETDSEGSDDTDEERAEEEEPTIKWQKVHKKMQQRPFLGLTPGPVDGKLPENGRELDFFHLIFPEHLWPTITKSTNKYAPFYEAMKKNTEKEDKRKHSFNEVTEDEIKAYVGIRMIMALSNHPSQTDYWSTHPALNNAYIAGIMPRYRYEQIKRLFHIADPETDPTRIKNTKLRKEESEKNPMYKVGDLLEEVRQRSMAMYNLNCEVSVDEAMIKFHGQHFGSVGAPNKPCKRGFKVFVLADAHEGYLYNYIVYLRKKRETGLTQRIVEDLMANLVGRHHIVFVDKFYTSIDLALSLLNKGTYINGSFNTSRVKWPLDLKPNKRLRKKNDPIRSLERGESQARQTNDGKLMACCWKDSALVCNLSTCHSGVPDEVTDTVLRKIRTEGHWQKSELVCPPSIKEFNKYMGGVDRHDHLRSSYTLQRSSSKWWLYFVWFAFDVALVNAYLLWKTNNPKTTHKAFQLKVATQLIGGFSTRQKRSQQFQQSQDLQPHFATNHDSRLVDGRGRVCMLCKMTSLKTASGRARETRHKCIQCNVHLHRECFVPYHERMVWKNKTNAATQTEDVQKESPTKRSAVRRSPRKAKVMKCD